MSNYKSYPYKRFLPNSAVICFEEDSYSWTWMTKKQKEYLAKSDYLKGARWIDVKFSDGSVRRFTMEEFEEWLKLEIQVNEGRER